MLSLAQQNHWREVYATAHPGWRPATEDFAARVRACLRPDARLLDVGCGRGGLIEQLAHPLSGIVGIDPDFASLREHRRITLPRAAARSDRLPFADHSFDVVIASWLLEHLEDPGATFAAIRRVLRSGGSFIFITPNARHPLAWANSMAGRLGRAQGRLVDHLYGRGESDTFPTIYRANTPAALKDLAANAGLSPPDISLIADPTYLAFNRTMFRLTCAIDDRLPPDRRIHLVGAARKPG
jgi:SAM-dependent methyltransferase